MNKKILRIVITGGPCGGKTTALEHISKIFREKGYTVLTVNETATELINDGIRPFGTKKEKLKLIDFQRLVLETQLYKEGIRDEAAKACSNDKVVIIYDRGILDNRAYITHKEFKALADARGLTEADILSRYDLVLHLVTAAEGQEKYYSNATNPARTEDAEAARSLDRKTMEAWSTHPNQYIFGNDCLFDEKINRVGNRIREFLGDKMVVDRQKYVIEIKDLDLSSFQGLNLIREEIEEFVRSDNENENEMFRKTTLKGNENSSYYTYTRIIYNEDGTKSTTQRNITENEYLDNLSRITYGEPIKKVRYNFIHNGERFRMDFYTDTNEFMTIERDVTNPKKENLPEFIKSATNITNNRSYSSANIYRVINKHREREAKNEEFKKFRLTL